MTGSPCVKVCKDCREAKPTSDFYRRAGSTHALLPRCKSCHCARTMQWARDNRERANAIDRRSKAKRSERIRAYNAQYRAENREAIADSWAEYYAANIARLRERARQWTRDNPDRAKANDAAYRIANPTRRAVNQARRRARQMQAPTNDVTVAQWQDRVTEFNGRCAYCLSPARLTQDHMAPLSKGGHHTIDNIVPACSRCNSAKGARPLWDFLATRRAA